MFANTGGYLSTLLFGYPGLRLGSGPPESWAVRPVVLPRAWSGIHVERLWMQGEPRSLTATAGARSAIIDGVRLRKAS
jgi:hypothetical protein